jgi:hypothetical protein
MSLIGPSQKWRDVRDESEMRPITDISWSACANGGTDHIGRALLAFRTAEHFRISRSV